MQLYYKDTMVEIWNGDSRRLSSVGDECVDLVLTSPPWWNGGDYRHPDQVGYGQSYEAFITDLTRIFGECFRCLRPGRRIVAWMADICYRDGRPSVPLAADVHCSLREVGFEFETTLIWHTPKHVSVNKGEALFPFERLPQVAANHVIIYKKPGDLQRPSDERVAASQIPTSYLSRADDPVWIFFQGESPPGLEEEWDSPVWSVIRFWSYVGDVVMDPFAGEGTFCAVAKRLGRRAIGVELNETSCEKAAEQCRKESFMPLRGTTMHEHIF
jgi:site-specific DNA-methyltransferase (adenine-specific)